MKHYMQSINLFCLIFYHVYNTVIYSTYAFVPGLSVRNYNKYDVIDIKVNSLTSIKAQLPYNFYFLPYCQPLSRTSRIETVGELLLGDTLEDSPFTIRMLENKKCQVLCSKILNPEEIQLFKRMIQDEYTINWIADGLPAVFPHPTSDAPYGDVWYSLGLPVGWKNERSTALNPEMFLNNYFSIVFKYRKEIMSIKNTHESTEMFQIVGFEVVPISVAKDVAVEDIDYPSECDALNMTSALDLFPAIDISMFRKESLPSNKYLNLDKTNHIHFLYDVSFQETMIPYDQRWNTYLHSQRLGPGQNNMTIHWFSIINSVVVVLLLAAVVGMILLRTLHQDIARYNQFIVATEDGIEETGWKLVHGDVFRKPQHSTVLAAMTGSGIQILCMVITTLVIATVGVGLYPSTGFGSGRLLQAGLVLWSLMGIIGGYTAARFYKLFESPNWKLTTIRTAITYPGVVFSIFLCVNCITRISHSSAAVPFSTIFFLILLWFGVSTPLIFLGAYFGFRQPAIVLPVRVNKIPRQVPLQPWKAHPIVLFITGGALPFGAVFTELMFLFSSIWNHRSYMLFGLLLLVTLMLIITCAEIAIVMVYSQLTSENYYWWWKSFFTCGFSGVYVFIYSLIYMMTRLSLSNMTAVVLFLSYSLIISYTFFILTGTIGFIACFLFIKSIYGSIRVE